MTAISNLVDDIVEEEGEEDLSSKALEHPDHIWFKL